MFDDSSAEEKNSGTKLEVIHQISKLKYIREYFLL